MTRAIRPRAVVFDFDGTIVDSLPLVVAAITHAIEPFATRPTEDILAQLGGPTERFLLTLLGGEEHLPAAMARLLDYHRGHAHQIRAYDGAPATLEELRRRGVRLALWTGRDRTSADWLLRHNGLDGYFTTMVCGDDLDSHKPDPAGLREIMRRLEVGPEDALLVGDGDADVLGGVGCGVDTLLIRHAREVETAIAAKSWRTVASPREAYAVVLGCVGKNS